MENTVAILSIVIFVGIAVYAYRHEKKRRPFLKNLERVKNREADLDGIRIVAERFGHDMVAWIAKTGKPRLFVTACGDMFEDFFPGEEPDRDLPPEERANTIMVSYLRRVAEADAKRGLKAADKNDLCFCEGAGFGLVAMRRLNEYIPELAGIINAMAEQPSANDAERYADYYREACRIARIRKDHAEAGLSARLEQFAGEGL